MSGLVGGPAGAARGRLGRALALGLALTGAAAAQGPGGLAEAAAFRKIGDEGTRSRALFKEMGKVLQHARCVNCHPAGNRPLQGEEGRPHQPPVARGTDGLGLTGMRCATCHHAENFDPANIPGHAPWALAPASMAWQGKSLREICEQLKDPGRNGGRSLAEVVHHMAEDGLVGWAWEPGGDRSPAPGSQAILGGLAKAWVETGAECPGE